MTDQHETVTFKAKRRVQKTELPDAPTWDGRWTKAQVVGPMNRNGTWLGEGCEAGDEAEFACSQDERGQWHGPEAEHFQQLLASGQIQGTEQAEAVAMQRRAIATEWGAYDEKTHLPARDEHGNLKHPDLLPKTAGEAVRLMAARDPRFAKLVRDPKEAQEFEERDRGDMMADFKRAMGVVAPLTASKGGAETGMADLSDDDLEAVLAARKARKGGK